MQSEVEALRKELEQIKKEKDQSDAENERLKKEVALLKSKLKQVAEKISKIKPKGSKNDEGAPEEVKGTELPRRPSRKKVNNEVTKKQPPIPNPKPKSKGGYPTTLQEILDSHDGYNNYTHPVFGVPLESIIIDDQPIHYFFRTTIKYLLSEDALQTTGLFRIPGSQDEIQHYKRLFDEGKEVTFNSTTSCHDVAGLLKEFIKNLPDPLIPNLFNAQVPYLIEEHKKRNDEASLLNELQQVISSLPRENYIFLRLLILYLAQIVSQSDKNKMTLDNIIKCIVPTVGCYPAIFFYTLGHASYFFD